MGFTIKFNNARVKYLRSVRYVKQSRAKGRTLWEYVIEKNIYYRNGALIEAILHEETNGNGKTYLADTSIVLLEVEITREHFIKVAYVPTKEQISSGILDYQKEIDTLASADS